MNNMHRITAILALLLCVPSFAMAFEFDDMCAPRTEHVPAFNAPNLGFMLDRSGSMDNSILSCTTSADCPVNYTCELGAVGELGCETTTFRPTRWNTAVDVINSVVNDLTQSGPCTAMDQSGCDVARFGIGFFSTSSDWEVPVMEDAAVAVADAITDEGTPDGATFVAGATATLINQASLQDASRTNVGIFITDGGPTGTSCNPASGARTSLRNAIRNLCNARNDAPPLTTYVVGYGEGATADTNSILAAGGGTGQCQDPSGVDVDVCQLTDSEIYDLTFAFDIDSDPDRTCYLAGVTGVTCTGSIETATPTQLKNAITRIAAEAACTFPLDVPSGYPDNAADVDPTATLVELNHTVFGLISPVPYVEDCTVTDNTLYDWLLSPTGGGVTDTAIADPFRDDGWCWANPARTGVRLSEELCNEVNATEIDRVYTQLACLCPNVGEACTITNVMVDNDGDGNPNEQATAEQLANMPCSTGIIECINNQEVCTATGGQLPEMCNARDDNCDGKVDNMEGSAADWAAASVDPQGRNCNEMSTCSCVMPTALVSTSATDLLASFDPASCLCGEGLDYDAPSQPTANSDEPQAGCAVAERDTIPGSLVLVLLIAGVAVLRRRQTL